MWVSPETLRDIPPSQKVESDPSAIQNPTVLKNKSKVLGGKMTLSQALKEMS